MDQAGDAANHGKEEAFDDVEWSSATDPGLMPSSDWEGDAEIGAIAQSMTQRIVDMMSGLKQERHQLKVRLAEAESASLKALRDVAEARDKYAVLVRSSRITADSKNRRINELLRKQGELERDLTEATSRATALQSKRKKDRAAAGEKDAIIAELRADLTKARDQASSSRLSEKATSRKMEDLKRMWSSEQATMQHVLEEQAIAITPLQAELSTLGGNTDTQQEQSYVGYACPAPEEESPSL